MSPIQVRILSLLLLLLASLGTSLPEGAIAQIQAGPSASAKASAKAENQEVIYFQLGLNQMGLQKYSDAATQFKMALTSGEDLADYSTFYLAQIAEKENNPVLAEKLYRDIGGFSPNIHLKIEAHKNLAKLLIEKKDFAKARAILIPLEKQARGADESAPVILYQLALAEKGLKNHEALCKWIRKLYANHPSFERILLWGSSLAVNDFENAPTRCSMTEEDFKTRSRNLIATGFETRAFAEIQAVRKELIATDPYLGDELLARYYLQQGEAFKALELLKLHFPHKQRDIEFLTLYAVAATRSGQNGIGVGAYYQAHSLAPRSPEGRRALYQAAFLSYQNQDYDGASRKFQEFIKKYGKIASESRSRKTSKSDRGRRSKKFSSFQRDQYGLVKDAQWYLAWLKYLRGDYLGAYNSFSSDHLLTTSSVQSSSNIAHGTKRKPSMLGDRTRYWMAMSLLRLSRSQEALPIFESLTKDPHLGYYSLVARGRLKQVQSQLLANNEALKSDPRFQSFLRAEQDISTKTDSLAGLTVLTDSSEESENLQNDEAEVAETRQGSILASANSASSDSASSESASSDSDSALPEPHAALPSRESKNSTLLNHRLKKALALQGVGLNDWAKWELYEIEKKTVNKDFLKTLIAKYSELKNYHRSSYLAQVHFTSSLPMIGNNNKALGPAAGAMGSKVLWQDAYPRAYSAEVLEHGTRFEVPTGLIWGIMRAESHYRQDAMSPVGAMGLMQVMPRTAQRMSEKLGIKDFATTQLLTPNFAIHIGTGYLKRLMGQFNQSTPLVAAAYNAGPHRVITWVRSFGSLQMDEFIEHIPFVETRNYVKKVVTNQQIYSQLYQLNQDLIPLLSSNLEVSIPERMTASKESWDGP